MNNFKRGLHDIGPFLLLWSTQALSGLGSAMTAYALVLWSYGRHGSALRTALLMVCSYTPYVLVSVFAGALSDRWDKKRTMLCCDGLAAAGTLAVAVLLHTGQLRVGHLYLINALTGLMNSVQQPASEVAVTLLLPEKYYQRAGGLSQLSGSVTTLLTPLLTTAVMGLWGMGAVLALDLGSFAMAALALLFFIHIPPAPETPGRRDESLLRAAGGGLAYLRREPGLAHMILFLAAVNLVSSLYEAAFPAMLLSRAGGGERVMGLVSSAAGLAMLAGSLLAAALPAPGSRVRTIWLCLFISLGTENFLLTFGRGPAAWCLGSFLGWAPIPLMNACMSALFRLRIPAALQGRVYAVRNCLQYFTIPLGYFLGGLAVDRVFEPYMASLAPGAWAARLVGGGRGSGAALLLGLLGLAGVAICLAFRRDRAIRALEDE